MSSSVLTVASDSTRPEERGPWLKRLGLPPFLLLAAGSLIYGILWGPYYDAAIFGVIGEQLARGLLPYRDAWDHKPPGTYALVAALTFLPGPTWPWIWAASVGFLGGTAEVVRRLTSWLPAVVALLCTGLWPLALGGGQTETFACLPAVAALLWAARGRFLVAGLLAGISLAFSLELLPLCAALLVLSEFRARALFSLLAGGTVVVLSVIATFAITGVLPAAIDVLVVYNRIYLGSDRTEDLPTAYQLLLAMLPLLVALPLRSARFTVMERAALAWILVAIVGMAVQGRLLPHYAIPLGIPLAVLAASPLRRPQVSALALVALAVVVPWSAGVALATFHSTHRGPATERVAAWIRNHTRSTDRLLVWGTDANIYLSSGRQPAGRYVYLIPLVTPGYTTPRLIGTWVADLARDPPRIIVDSEAANPHWSEGADFFRPPPPGAAGGRDLDLLQPLRDFVKQDYVLVAEIAGRKVYELATK